MSIKKIEETHTVIVYVCDTCGAEERRSHRPYSWTSSVSGDICHKCREKNLKTSTAWRCAQQLAEQIESKPTADHNFRSASVTGACEWEFTYYQNGDFEAEREVEYEQDVNLDPDQMRLVIDEFTKALEVHAKFFTRSEQ